MMAMGDGVPPGFGQAMAEDTHFTYADGKRYPRSMASIDPIIPDYSLGVPLLRGATTYPASALSPQAKQAEDREAMMASQTLIDIRAAADAVNNSRKVGATGATSYGATGATMYPYSALSPQAKQAEDRIVEIGRIARLIAASAHPHIDPESMYCPYEPARTPMGGYFTESSSSVPFWYAFRDAAEAVYEDRRK